MYVSLSEKRKEEGVKCEGRALRAFSNFEKVAINGHELKLNEFVFLFSHSATLQKNEMARFTFQIFEISYRSNYYFILFF